MFSGISICPTARGCCHKVHKGDVSAGGCPGKGCRYIYQARETARVENRAGTNCGLSRSNAANLDQSDLRESSS